MKRILLALVIGMSIYTAATATTAGYAGPGKHDSLAKDTVPKRDTSRKKDSTRLDMRMVPGQ